MAYTSFPFVPLLPPFFWCNNDTVHSFSSNKFPQWNCACTETCRCSNVRLQLHKTIHKLHSEVYIYWFSQQFTLFIYVILLNEITANHQEEEEENKSFTASRWHSQHGKSYCHRLTEWVGLAEAKCLDGLILVYLDLAVIPPNEQLNQLWQGAVIVLCHWKVYRLIKPSEQDEMRHEISWHQPVFLSFSLFLRNHHTRVEIKRNVQEDWLP